jgi:outer membrane protein assembly factor BamB
VGSSQFLTSSSPAVANGIVYYVSPGGRIYALRASNGKADYKSALDFAKRELGIA